MNHIKNPDDPNNSDLKFLAIASQFEIIEGVLVRLEYRNHRRAYQYQVYVSTHLRLSVLKENHDNISAKHLEIKKTHEKIRQKYYWPGIYRDTSHYVRKCHPCGAKKGNLTPNIGKANAIYTSRSNEIVEVDHIVKLPTIKEGNVAILVLVDLFTKLVELVPVKDFIKETTACHINNYICRYGAPKKLLSDRGGAFFNEVIEELIKLWGTKKIFTTPYHPQTNSNTERFNRTLYSIITPYCTSNHDNWDELLNIAAFAYNTAVQSSTRETPAFMTFGRDLRAPTDFTVPQDNNETVPT